MGEEISPTRAGSSAAVLWIRAVRHRWFAELATCMSHAVNSLVQFLVPWPCAVLHGLLAPRRPTLSRLIGRHVERREHAYGNDRRDDKLYAVTPGNPVAPTRVAVSHCDSEKYDER